MSISGATVRDAYPSSERVTRARGTRFLRGGAEKHLGLSQVSVRPAEFIRTAQAELARVLFELQRNNVLKLAIVGAGRDNSWPSCSGTVKVKIHWLTRDSAPCGSESKQSDGNAQLVDLGLIRDPVDV
jgi:hypothetical protein